MLNQVFNYIFGNSPSISHTDTMPGTVATNQAKKRGADLTTVLAEECNPAPPRKRGRPLGSTKLKKANQMTRQVVARSCKKNASEVSDSSGTEREPIVKRTRRNYIKQNNSKTKVHDTNSSDENRTANDSNNTSSEYETTDNETTEQPKRNRNLRQSKTETNVRRSSRNAVLSAPNKQSSLPRVSSTAQHISSLYRSSSDPVVGQNSCSSAYLSRRSRRSRNVDLSKDLVIMLPGDDPREMAQLDLRGEVEWDEFLVAMAEDTTMLGSDNEDPTAEHTGILPIALTHQHSSSTYSVSGLAPFGTSEKPPVLRRRTSSSASLSRMREEQQLHYVDITAGSSSAMVAEVCVPEVKEAEAHKTLSVINWLLCSSENNKERENDNSRGLSLRHKTTTASSSSGLGRPRSSSNSSSVMDKSSSSSSNAEVVEVVEQIHRDKERGGYDHPLYILPEAMRHVNEMYVDYDADSEDERFIESLQSKLLKTSDASNKLPSKTQGHKVKTEEHNAAAGEPTLKVRCLELMIARLEREFELARLFSSRESDMRTVSEGKGAIDESVPYETSIHNFHAPVGGASRSAVTALQTALDNANSSYKLAKRFLVQESSQQNEHKNEHTNSKSSKINREPKQKESASSPEMRHQKGSCVTSGKSYQVLEKLQNQEEEAQALNALAAHSNSANLQSELDHRNTATSSSLSGRQIVHRTPVGRPPLVPRSVLAPTAIAAETSKHGDQEERRADSYREYYTLEEISGMLPEHRTKQLLQNMLREFCLTTRGQQESGSEAGPAAPIAPAVQKHAQRGRPRSNSNLNNGFGSETAKTRSSNDVSESETAVFTHPVSVFGIESEELIAHEVYEHWRRRRSVVSTSLVRAFHRYIMDLWTRAESVMIPMALDYLPGSAKDIHDRLLKVRFALDRGRTYADRCRRRERLKRDLLRLSSEQLDVLQEEVYWLNAPKSTSPSHDRLASSTAAGAILKTPLASKAASAVSMNHLSQGRDHRGKFLSSRKNATKKAAATPSAAPVGSSNTSNSNAKPFTGPNRTGKSVRHHTVRFSIPPGEDEAAATLAATGEYYSDVDEFSSCSSTDMEDDAYLSDTGPLGIPEESPVGAKKSRKVDAHSAQSTPSSCKSTPSQSKKAARSIKHKDDAASIVPVSGRDLSTPSGSSRATAATPSKGDTATAVAIATEGGRRKEDSVAQLRPGSRSRLTSAPDCSLRHLPYSSSSSTKKRKL